MTVRPGHNPDTDRDVCERFERAWRDGCRLQIDECLPAEDDSAYLQVLEELVHIDLEYSWKAHSQRTSGDDGQEDVPPEERPPRVEDYVARFGRLDRPDILSRLLKQEQFVRHMHGDEPDDDEFRMRFPDIDLLSHETAHDPAYSETVVKSDSSSCNDEIAATSPETSSPICQSFGEYDVLNVIGRGGMGIVYKAHQRNADRIVALKVIRNDRLKDLSPAARQNLTHRFRTEAQAAARLHHENIVTVYDVGEHEGQPYYSMQFVEGQNLLDRLADGPLPNRVAARWIRSVALAVHAAHQNGVLHRDLKPHNIMIEAKTDRPLVADFGLAKLLEGREQLTHDGDVVGTPSYMSPEQATNSAKVTTLSDVYSIGATLYHLMTGGPPFRGESVFETIRKVTDLDVQPPSQVTPSVDRDLETISLKCLQKEPGARYGSAAELAAELERYLNGEPILARPVSRTERIVRWTRRNPAMAIAVASAAFFLLAALVATSVGYFTTHRALSKAEKSLQQTRTTIDDLFTEVSESDLLNAPGMQPLRKQLLQRALWHYELLVEEYRDVDALRDELGATWYRIGNINEYVASLESALSAYEQAREIQSVRLEAEPHNMERVAEFATTLNAIGTTLSRLRRNAEALETLTEAQQLREKLVETHPEETEPRRLLANTLMNQGLVWRALQDNEQAESLVQESISVREELLTRPEGRQRNVLRDQAMAYLNLANLELDRNRLEASHDQLRKAVELFDALADSDPQDLELRQRQANAYWLLGELLFELGDVPASEHAYARAESISRQLADENPRVPEFALEFGRIQLMLGSLLFDRGDLATAADRFQEAGVVFRPLVDSGELGTKAQLELAKTNQLLAVVYETQGGRDKAIQQLRMALELLEEVTAAGENSAEAKAQLSATKEHLRQLGDAVE